VRLLQLSGRALVTIVATLALGGARKAATQTLPSDPIVFGDGHVTVGGDVSATFSCAPANSTEKGPCADDGGFFNYSDYSHSLLRAVRLDLAASVKAGSRVSFLTEFRTENLSRPQPYALYVRIRPWKARRVDIQAGRIPPTFGGFSRRTYPSDNPLIGYPLAYQYLTSLRPDALPANANELLKMRGRGWLSNFSVGDPTPAAGVPLVNVLSWDTGVQVHAATDVIDAALSVTAGTLSHPLVRDDNGGRQVSGRVALHPLPGLIIGGSGSRGPFVSRSAANSAAGSLDAGALTQTAWGVDVEYSRGYYLVRAETIVSDWRLPEVAGITAPLRAWSTSLEGRYKIRPGLFAAARLEHLDFSDITGSAGVREWEAPVSRVEAGLGYSLQRNLLLKLSYQHNARDGGRVPVLSLGAVQLVFWF
jgi:hypothetical protein